jgi:hypothetical protein
MKLSVEKQDGRPGRRDGRYTTMSRKLADAPAICVPDDTPCYSICTTEVPSEEEETWQRWIGAI